MILQQVFDKVRRLTNTSVATLPDSDLIKLVNEAYLEIQRELAQNSIEIFGAISKTDIVANQTNYSLPNNVLSIIRVEIAYNDPNNENDWRKIERVDLANLPYDWVRLIRGMPLARPLYDLFNNSIWVFPAPKENKIQGLRLWYVERQPDFITTNDEIPFALENYWEVLAYATAYYYLEEIGHPQSQRKFEIYHLKLKRMISDLVVENNEAIKIMPIY